MKKITVTITIPEDYPEGRKKLIPEWIASHLIPLDMKGYVDEVWMQIDDERNMYVYEAAGWIPVSEPVTE